jgi:hypothetical protein
MEQRVKNVEDLCELITKEIVEQNKTLIYMNKSLISEIRSLREAYVRQDDDFEEFKNLLRKIYELNRQQAMQQPPPMPPFFPPPPPPSNHPSQQGPPPPQPVQPIQQQQQQQAKPPVFEFSPGKPTSFIAANTAQIGAGLKQQPAFGTAPAAAPAVSIFPCNTLSFSFF